MPRMFIKSTDTSGSLYARCDDFRKLTPQEQTAQVQYLWPHWLKREYLEKLSQHGRVFTNPTYARVSKKYGDEMRDAQRIWEQRFGKSLLDTVTTTLATTRKRLLEFVGVGQGSAKRRRR